MARALSTFGNLGRSLGRNLGPRTRKLLRYVGFGVLALVTFVFAFQLTFPFDRVKDKVVEALSPKYDVTIGDVERGIMPGRMYFKALTLRTRPAKASDVATTFYIERLEVDLGLFALLHGTVAVKLDAKIGPGQIKGKVAIARSGTAIDMTGDDLPSASLPMREVLGLPMSGKVRFSFDLDLPNEKAKATGQLAPNWAKATGGAEFACPSGCTVGDGKSKLKLTTKNARSQAFLDEGGGGIDFGKVNIDSLFASVAIKSGKLDITKFEAKSGDGELHVVFSMALNQDLNSSLVTGCLRFRGSEALLKREPKTHAAISTTGAPLGPDNLFHIRLDGPLREVRRLGQVCGPSVNTNLDNPGGTTPRPNLALPPPTPQPTPGAAPPPPPPPAEGKPGHVGGFRGAGLPPEGIPFEAAGGRTVPAGSGEATPQPIPPPGGGQPTGVAPGTPPGASPPGAPPPGATGAPPPAGAPGAEPSGGAGAASGAPP